MNAISLNFHLKNFTEIFHCHKSGMKHPNNIAKQLAGSVAARQVDSCVRITNGPTCIQLGHGWVMKGM